MTTPDPTSPGRPHRPHLVATLTTLVLPLAVLASGVGLALSWRDRLPDPVATHWGTEGVDGVGSLGSSVTVAVVVVLLFTAGMTALTLRWGQAALTRRLAAGFAVWFAVVQTGVLLGSLAGQRGLHDAYRAPGIGAALAVTFAIATVLALTAALLIPGDPEAPSRAAIPPDAPRLPLTASERVTWVRRTTQQHAWTITAGAAAFALTLGTLTRLWWLTLVIVVGLGVVLAGALRWTITVDATGLRARSALGFGLRVPLSEVEGARVTTVAPVRQFGGWGLRIGAGGTVGVITRKGEGIEVSRSEDRRVVVTVDDAATGAALLNTLAEQAQVRRA